MLNVNEFKSKIFLAYNSLWFRCFPGNDYDGRRWSFLYDICGDEGLSRLPSIVEASMELLLSDEAQSSL